MTPPLMFKGRPTRPERRSLIGRVAYCCIHVVSPRPSVGAKANEPFERETEANGRGSLSTPTTDKADH